MMKHLRPPEHLVEAETEHESAHHGFSRTDTTNVRPQSLIYYDVPPSDALPADRAHTKPSAQPDLFVTSLEEHTLPGLLHVEQLDADALLARLAKLPGFTAGAIIDVEWDELLAQRAPDDLDIELVAQLTLVNMPQVQGHLPQELVHTTDEHYELMITIEGPFLTLYCYSVWQRATTDFACARAATISAVMFGANKRRA